MDKVGRSARPCQQGKGQMERKPQSMLGIDVSKATLDVVLVQLPGIWPDATNGTWA